MLVLLGSLAEPCAAGPSCDEGSPERFAELGSPSTDLGWAMCGRTLLQ